MTSSGGSPRRWQVVVWWNPFNDKPVNWIENSNRNRTLAPMDVCFRFIRAETLGAQDPMSSQPSQPTGQKPEQPDGLSSRNTHQNALSTRMSENTRPQKQGRANHLAALILHVSTLSLENPITLLPQRPTPQPSN
jgi:hypothetical protein